VQENLSGARVVRAYVQEAAECDRFAETNREYMRRSQRLILLSGGIFPAVQLLTGLGVVLVLWQGGSMVITGRITLGALVAFGAYLAMLHWPTIAIGWVINIFERGEASMGRLRPILETPTCDAPAVAPGGRSISGAVELRGLSFSYDGRPVLRDIDLKVAAGSTIAIVGPTGSGKSTLVSLIARLYEVPPGTLFIDGHDICSLALPTLRAAIGFVPQETFLFSDTLAANIAFGAPDASAEQIRDLAELAQLAHDVHEFPKGYDTLVGERGITLSGGQKQRTAIARALASDPRIVILDDALSAVDTLTEGEILRGLRAELRGRTTFLVSHRVSTVKDAEWIVVLREGRIVEQGTHTDLVERGGFYSDLHQRQLIEDEMDVESA
jgi:ATP-binding cassette, subfamily B, multidrug efflux pump